MNAFPEMVTQVKQTLGVRLPSFGKVRIAQLLARAGLHLSASIVKRMRERPPPQPPTEKKQPSAPKSERVVSATHPNHLWNADVTTVPVRAQSAPGLYDDTEQPWRAVSRPPTHSAVQSAQVLQVVAGSS